MISALTNTGSGQTVDFRFDGLRDKWAALRAAMPLDSEIMWAAEWVALDEVLGVRAEEAPAVVLPKAIPDSFPDDPPFVRRVEAWRSHVNKRLWTVMVPTKGGELGDFASLWMKAGTPMKLGWKIYVQPNPSVEQGGFVLYGQYNRAGERVK